MFCCCSLYVGGIAILWFFFGAEIVSYSLVGRGLILRMSEISLKF